MQGWSAEGKQALKQTLTRLKQNDWQKGIRYPHNIVFIRNLFLIGCMFACTLCLVHFVSGLLNI
jgi:hypothetical protein